MNVIIDYGLGNLNSVKKAFNQCGIETIVSNDDTTIKNASSIVLPGVGAFRDAIVELKKTKLIPTINNHVKQNKPLLGICLGMQLLYERSYENGNYEGLGYLKGEVKKLDVDLKIPHMGWNALYVHKKDAILENINEEEYVYFVHSYYIDGRDDDLIAYAKYGRKIPAIVRKNQIYGMQFHPEKSGEVGYKIIKAYGEMLNDTITRN